MISRPRSLGRMVQKTKRRATLETRHEWSDLSAECRMSMANALSGATIGERGC
jgi:hypothetical protein